MSFWQRLQSAARDFLVVVGPAWRKTPWVLFLMLVLVALELTAVLLAAPFVSLLISSNELGFAVPSRLVNIGLPTRLSVEVIGGMVAGVFVIKAIMSARLQYAISWFAEQRKAELMVQMLASFQSQPYEFHLSRSSSELVNRIVWETSFFTNAGLVVALRLVVESIIVIVLVTLLIISDWHALVLLVACLAIVFVVVLRAVRRETNYVNALSQSSHAGTINAVQQALGAYREVRLLGRERIFQQALLRSANDQAVSSARAAGLAVIPKQAIEATVVCFLVALVYSKTYGGTGLDGVLPTLGTFAVAAMRLMPASTAILSCVASLRAARPFAAKLAKEISELPVASAVATIAPSPPRVFESFELRSVTYQYPNQSSPALQDVNLVVKKGDLLGIMGRSGAGKSTLADVLLGFLEPTSGEILVNGRQCGDGSNGLRDFAAYIPQTVYLLDDSIRRNVAFGEEDSQINDARIWDALRKAQLADFVTSQEESLDMRVGERGVRMSGGQRQRVAIARAIYHGREIIVLDEATSALDTQTERDVIEALNQMHGQQTLIVIAHKASVLAVADQVVHISNGRARVEHTSAVKMA